MRRNTNIYLWVLSILLSGFIYIASCTHKDIELPDGSSSNGSNITRGTAVVSLNDGKTTFDKVHSNVNWETAYLGAISMLTGRFNTFGFNSFHFEESKPDSIYFEAYVYLNSVNTSEIRRDTGCLMGTFGTQNGLGYEPVNLAIIKSKKVVFSTTDKGYIVTADLTFHGVTKELTAKLSYDGKIEESTYVEHGFSLVFSFLSISDFAIEPGETADNVDITCNAAFKFAL